MCGVAGLVSLGRELSPVQRDAVRSMTETLHHRGPDAGGFWADDYVALGHRRLAILDLSEAGAQPMRSRTGRFVLAFNGEIYNHRQIALNLSKIGWRPKGHSDTEVLLAAVESWGLRRTLESVDGMFAFAVYDRRSHRLSLVRDRLGEKPLHYATHGAEISFASELRAFAKLPGFDHSLDCRSLEDYFRYGYVPGQATIFRRVRRVPPATVVEIDLGRSSVESWDYWRPPELTGVHQGQVDLEQLHGALSRSVNERMIADRPVGAFLSGGIDSSLICALAARHSSGPLKTFTMGWDEPEHDESEQAALVASAVGADHHAVRLSRHEVVDAVRRLGSVTDEPFADPSQLSMLLVAEMASESVVVALSGDGGDELFGGYNRHRWLLATQSVRQRLPVPARRLAARAGRALAPTIDHLTRPIPTTFRPRLVADKVRKLGNALEVDSLAEAYQAVIAIDPAVGLPVVIEPVVASAFASDNPDEVLWGLRCADLGGWLPDDILTKVDRASMAVSLESRAPFLDSEVVALALRMGRSELLARSGGKQPLRSLLRGELPHIPFDQKKTGFGMPVESLLRKELADDLANAVSSHEARGLGVNIGWRRRLRSFHDGDDQVGASLWSLLMFELWATSRQDGVSIECSQAGVGQE